MGHIIYYLNQNDADELGKSNFYKKNISEYFQFTLDIDKFDLYITKEFLNKYNDFIENIFNVKNFKEYNLYCDFTDDKELIEKVRKICNIKEFKTINENKDLLIGKSLIDIISLYLKKRTKYYKELSNINFNGIYVEDYYKILNGLTSYDEFSGSLAETFSVLDIIKICFNNKTLILKSDFKDILSFDLEYILNDYDKVILKNDKNKVLYDYNYTFLGLFDEYLENEDEFNKTYKDIKYMYSLSEKNKNRYSDIDKSKIINFYKKLGLSDNIINFIKNSYRIIHNYYVLVVYINNKFLDIFLNEYANKSEFFQCIIITAFNFYANKRDISNVVFTAPFSTYFKYLNKFKNTINFTYYVDNIYYKFLRDFDIVHKFMKLDDNNYILKYSKYDGNIELIMSDYDKSKFKIKHNKDIFNRLKVFMNIDNFIIKKLM